MPTKTKQIKLTHNLAFTVECISNKTQYPSVRVAYIWPVLGFPAEVMVCFPSYSSNCNYTGCPRVPVTQTTQALIYITLVPPCDPEHLAARKHNII